MLGQKKFLKMRSAASPGGAERAPSTAQFILMNLSAYARRVNNLNFHFISLTLGFANYYSFKDKNTIIDQITL